MTGQCPICRKEVRQPDDLEEWVQFDEPIPAKDGFPAIEGVWRPVHPACAAEDRVTRPLREALR
jgi:hypothetical protein